MTLFRISLILLAAVGVLTVFSLTKPAVAAKAVKHPVAVMQTSKGVIEITLFPEDAPISVANFVKLTKRHFYDGTKIHRVDDLEGPGLGHIIQGGDPLTRTEPATAPGVGTGGPGWTIKGEFAQNGVKNPLTHKAGAFAMARMSDPDSAGSQFYICTTSVHSLDGNYAVFGQVTKGLDVAKRLAVGDVIKKVTIK